jgi:hypothetical protein
MYCGMYLDHPAVADGEAAEHFAPDETPHEARLYPIDVVRHGFAVNLDIAYSPDFFPPQRD